MKKIFGIIWDDRLLFFLTIVFLGGLYLYFDRPTVQKVEDLTKVSGTLSYVEQVLVYGTKVKKNERDSSYHIHLNEYPSKFQVSYSSYNRKDFYSQAKKGDSLILHIANTEYSGLRIPDQKIRSFSLTLNSKEYLSVQKGLRGFGKGIFELIIIFVPLTIVIIQVVRKWN